MDDTQIAEGLRACEGASPAPWHHEDGTLWFVVAPTSTELQEAEKPHSPMFICSNIGEKDAHCDMVFVEPKGTGQQQVAEMSGPNGEADAAFIVQARNPTTGYAAALEEVATGRREYAVIRDAYLTLLKGVQDWVGNTNSCMALPGDLDKGCGECPQCGLAALVANTGPAAPPFAEEKDKEREQLEKDAAAYRELLAHAKNWANNAESASCGPCGEDDCSQCNLVEVIAAAEPGLPHSCCDEKRQGAEKRERLKDLCRAEHRKLT